MKKKLAVLNARIPAGLKKAMTQYCDERGLKVQSFIENLIQERLEDVLDQKMIDERLEEPTVSFEAVVAALGLEEDLA